uniref:N/A n=1 Tax=Ganoderma boninense TaxID=34458 RepID=A0A5K1JZI2_9APHY|nr:N/A [Ganoderma boninense]
MTYFTTAFGTLIGSAKSNLCNLTSLTVQLLGPIGKYLRGAPFRLARLDTTAEWDADFVAFLEEQPSICFLIHHGKYRSEVQLPPSALPNLSFVEGWPSLVSALLAGRPVKEILITCLANMVDENTFQDLGRLGKLSRGPISVVTVVNSVTEMNPADLFFLMLPVAENLSHLALFHYNTRTWGLDEARLSHTDHSFALTDYPDFPDLNR